MLANLCPVPTQPYSRREKWCWRLRPTRSTITRLPSGSFASRSTSFRSGAFGVGDRYCPPLHGRVGGTSAHPHSAGDSSFGVVLRIHAHVRPHGLGRNTSHKPCDSPLHPSAQSRLSPESPAPWLMRLVRPRYMSGIPFLLNTAQAIRLAPTDGQWKSLRLYFAQEGWGSTQRQ